MNDSTCDDRAVPPTWGDSACTWHLFAALVLAAGWFGLYMWLAASLQHQHWDSLSYAMDAEDGKRWAIVGNHPLTHILWSIILRTARAAGYAGRALPLLKVVNCAIGGCAVGMLHWVLAAELRVRAARAAGLASLFGGTAVMLRYMGSADIYSLAVLVSVAAWGMLIRGACMARPSGWHWAMLGVVTGLAALTHQLHGLFIPVGFWFAWRHGVHRLRMLSLCMLGAVLIGGCGYLVMGYIATGSVSPARVWPWITGRLDNPYCARWFSLLHLRLSATTLAATVAAPGWGVWLPLVRACLLGMVCLLPVVFIAVGPRRRGVVGEIASAAAVQIAVTGMLVQWYAPWAQKFWLLTFVPAAVCLGALAAELGQQSASLPRFRRIPGPAVCLLAACLFAFNVWTCGLPQRTDWETFDRALRTWIAHTKPGDVLVTVGDLTHHLRFWENRPFTQTTDDIAMVPHTMDRFGAIRSEMRAAHDRGDNVFVADGVHEYVWGVLIEHSGVTRDDIRAFFSQFPREYAFTYTNDVDQKPTRVYRLLAP